MEFKSIKKRIKTRFKLNNVNRMYLDRHRLLSMFIFSFLTILVINSSFIYCNEEEISPNDGKFFLHFTTVYFINNISYYRHLKIYAKLLYRLNLNLRP